MEKSQFWGVNKKLAWAKMPMGAINVSLVFGMMVSDLQQKCQAEVEHQNIRKCGLEVIIYDIVLFKLFLSIILQYFEVVL